MQLYHTRRLVGLCCLVGLGLVALLLQGVPAKADMQTVSFFSVWQGNGSYHPLGDNQMVFVGSISGPVYVETPEGPAAGGYMSCLGNFDLEMDTALQSGEGICYLVPDDGSIVAVAWTCDGVHMVGCSGEMTVTSGKGRFEGATGGGDFTIRGSLHDAHQTGGGVASAEIDGIIVWEDFTYEVPD